MTSQMDIQMPIMDGLEATKEIRHMEKLYGSNGTPSSVIIVALTASSLLSDREAALSAGCNDFLSKPVSLPWLNNKIVEWGSMKELQMWADLRPALHRMITERQEAMAKNVARHLHLPYGHDLLSRFHNPSRTPQPSAGTLGVPSVTAFNS
jgi:osomolarity two-component system response regulator SSK1